MNDFDTALGFVTDSLRKLQEGNSRLKGSRESLRRLATARPAPSLAPAPLPAAAPISAPGPRPPATPPPPEGLPTVGSKSERIDRLRAIVLPCLRCPHLARSRTQVVFGVGNIDASIMFVGEAPGADEDAQGEPFVGKAGQLLTKIIEAAGLKRSDVFIANVLKCRPDMPPGESGNRRPTAPEMQTCLPYLREQIDIIRPRVLVALGSVAMEGLLGATEPMARLRGRWHEFQGIPLMATYHPAYLLRNQSLTEKRKVWEDMLKVMEQAELPISDRQRSFFLANH